MATNPLGFLQNIVQTGEQDVAGAAQKVMDFLNQPKSRVKEQPQVPTQAPVRTKQNGAISQSPVGQNVGQQVRSSVNNFKTSPLYDLMTGAASKIPEQISSDIAATNGQLRRGDISPLMGMIAPDSGGELNAEEPTMTDAQTERISDTNPAGKNPVQNLDLSKKYGIYAPDHETAAQNTLDTVVKGDNPESVAADLNPAVGRLGKQIDQIVGNNDSTTSKPYPNGVTYQDLADDMQAKAQSQGLMKTPEGRKAVNKAIAQQINYISGNADAINGNATSTAGASAQPVFNDDLSPATIKGPPISGTTQFRRMGGVKPGQAGPPGYLKEVSVKGAEPSINEAQPPSQLNPNAENPTIPAQQPLSMSTLRNEYKAANEDNAALLKRRASANAKPLTDTESAQLLYRDSLGDTISKVNPNIKDLITKQSHIYDAAPDVFKARADYRADQAKQAEQNAKGTAGKGNFFTRQPLLARIGEIAGITTGIGALATQAPSLYNYLTSDGGSAPNIKFSGDQATIDKNGNMTLPDPNAIGNTPTPQKIPNDPSIYTHGIYPYQIAQKQQQLQNLQNQLKANPYNPALPNEIAGLSGEIKTDTDQMNADIANYTKAHPTNDQMVDNKKTDAQNIKAVIDNLNKGALPNSGSGVLMNKLSSEGSLQAKNQNYADLYARAKSLEQDGVIPQGTITKDMTANEAKKKFLQALTTYYSKLARYEQNYRFTPDYSQPQPKQTTNTTTQQPAPSAAPAPTDVPSANQGQTIDQSLYKFIPPSMLNQVQNSGQGGGYTSSDLLNSILQKAIV